MIPVGHSRESRFPLMGDFLRDRHAARAVDCARIRVHIRGGDMDRALEMVPRDFIALRIG